MEDGEARRSPRGSAAVGSDGRDGDCLERVVLVAHGSVEGAAPVNEAVDEDEVFVADRVALAVSPECKTACQRCLKNQVKLSTYRNTSTSELKT